MTRTLLLSVVFSLFATSAFAQSVKNADFNAPGQNGVAQAGSHFPNEDNQHAR